MILERILSENGIFLRGKHVSLFKICQTCEEMTVGPLPTNADVFQAVACLSLFTPGPFSRFQCDMHRRHLRSSFDMLFKRLKDHLTVWPNGLELR